MPQGEGRPSAYALASFVLRLLMGGIFALSGLSKISDPMSFIATLWAYKLMPDPVVPLLTVYLPWLELELGLLMILGLFWRTSAMIMVCLNVLFTIAIASLVMRGIEVDCGCFGMLSDLLGLPDSADWTAVIRDIIFTAMSLYVFMAKETAFALEDYIRKRGPALP